MKKKTKTASKKKKGLLEGWTLPALVDRRRAPRPVKLTAAQKARAIAKRKRDRAS